MLLDGDDNLIAGRPWEADGFTVAPFLMPADYARLVAGVAAILARRMTNAGLAVPEPFSLERYHEVVTTRRGPRRRVGPGPVVLRAERPAGAGGDRQCQGERDPRAARVHHAAAHASSQSTSASASCGPAAATTIPPHRDVWLDRLRNAINIYVPLAGSSPQSSLPLVRGSHRWPESEIERTLEGARVNGMVYTVPSVVGAAHPLTLERPDPRANEVLVFSPYLIHGGAFNQQTDRTRVSLEMRFWRVA